MKTLLFLAVFGIVGSAVLILAVLWLRGLVLAVDWITDATGRLFWKRKETEVKSA